MNKTQETKPYYPPESAGRLMTSEIPIVSENATVGDVEQLLLKEAKNFETIDYIYIVDSKKKLIGALSIKELFRSPKTTHVKKFLPQEVVSVRTHTDQEHVAFLALKHNIKAVPVVDKENLLLGVVPSDVILQALDSEAVENILRFGGVVHSKAFDSVLTISIFKSLKHRLPWLILGLIGGMLAARIVSGFEEVLSRNIILAAFIPLIVYTSDAVGTQMEAFIIRDLAVNPKINFTKYFFRQLAIVSLIGIIVSILFLIASVALYDNARIGFVLALALFFATLSSVLTGLIIPFLFGKLNLDPANASGPIATIIQDILSVLVYFSIASWLL